MFFCVYVSVFVDEEDDGCVEDVMMKPTTRIYLPPFATVRTPSVSRTTSVQQKVKENPSGPFRLLLSPENFPLEHLMYYKLRLFLDRRR